MRVRVISADEPDALALALRRAGLPSPAPNALVHAHLLVTGGPLPAGLRDACSQAGVGFLPGEQGAWVLSGAVTSLRALEGLVPTLRAALDSLERPPPPLKLGQRQWEFGRKTYVMGVVNVTPDSFSDGGNFLETEAAVRQGLALAAAGADLLDVGGESTRPGARKVSADEELSRVLPVIRALRERTDVPVSVDTTKAAVARECLAAGAALVNDISGLSFDGSLAREVAAAGAACCLMHIQGTPETMQKDPRYDDVVEEVTRWLAEAQERALAAGVRREQLLVDPGIGFGKTLGHNLVLMRRLRDLRVLGAAVLVGTSRKSFLGALTGGKSPQERVWATVGSVAAAAVLGGADVVRVHDVAEAKDALAVADAIRLASEAGSLFAPAP